MLVRRLLALALLALLAACGESITAAEEGESRGGTMVTSGG
ncbi:MAG TPA: hypothetical protein VFR37_01940 [Longimicrobium sp.]|nr:hypothetical protein [Longimicrobium sp.]